jgi:hypothetical protein
MISLLRQANDWKDATLRRLQKRSWKAWAVVAFEGYVVIEIVRAWVLDASTLLLTWAFLGLQWVVRQPMGVGGLGLFST